MIINLSPDRVDMVMPTVVYSKDTLTINGEIFDFGPLPEGAILPRSAIDSYWFASNVTRVNGEILLTLRLPYRLTPPSDSVAFPKPIRVTKAGAVKLPFDVPEPAEEIAHVD